MIVPKPLILFLGITFPMFCQQTKVQPDCTLGAVFTTTGNSANYDNRSVSTNSGVPCTLWSLTWSAQSTVTSLTINIEGAPDSNGTPGTFASLASGSTFPSGKVTYSASTAYSPWVRITVSVAGSPGEINATLNGWREDQASIGGGGGGSGCPGTTGTPCVVVGPTASGAAPTDSPVQIAGLDGAGNIITPTYATLPVAISLTSSGLTQLIAGSSGKQIRIEHISVSFASAVNFQLEYGTGSSCGTSTTALTGVYQSVVGIALDFDSGTLNVPSGNSLCANLGSSVTGGGLSVYAQY